MQRGKWRLVAAVAITLFVGFDAGANPLDIAGTDVVTQYDSSTKVLSSGADGFPGTVVEPNSGTIFGADINYSIVMDGAGETFFSLGTRFVGANAGSADVWITDPNTFDVLLTIEVNEIIVTNYGHGAAGETSTFVNLGGIDQQVNSGQSDVTITGGTLANDFGGAGTNGLMFILLNAPSKAIPGPFPTPPQIFSSSFTAQSNTQFNFLPIPEPSTAVLLAGPLMGLGFWRRGTRLRGKL